MLELLPLLLQGAAVTVKITALAALLALTLAFGAGLLRLSPVRLLRWAAALYVEVFRGTSLLVQLFWLYFVLPLPPFRIELSPFTVAVIGLGLNIGAYGAEVVRGAILAVPISQYEAATALNLSPYRAWRDVIIPQAIPPILPALGNYLVAMFKDTPLLSAIAVVELMQRAKIIGSETFRYLGPITLVGVFFLLMSLIAAAGIRRVERTLKHRQG